jgi:hypothetical protein
MESGLITPSALIRTGAAKGVTSGLFKIRIAMGGHLWFTPVSSKYLLLQALPG